MKRVRDEMVQGHKIAHVCQLDGVIGTAYLFFFSPVYVHKDA